MPNARKSRGTMAVESWHAGFVQSKEADGARNRIRLPTRCCLSRYKTRVFSWSSGDGAPRRGFNTFFPEMPPFGWF